MLDGFGFAPEMNGSSTKDRLIHKADAAFNVGDKATCIEAIAQLYCLFDGEMELEPT